MTIKINIYVLEVNPVPAFFGTIDNAFGDDYVTSHCFEGGHETPKGLIIECKLNNIDIAYDYDKLSYHMMVFKKIAVCSR